MTYNVELSKINTANSYQKSVVQSKPLEANNCSKTITVPLVQEATVLDALNSELLDITPDFALNMIPDDYLKFSDSAGFCITDNVSAYQNLPRKSDGEIDENERFYV